MHSPKPGRYKGIEQRSYREAGGKERHVPDRKDPKPEQSIHIVGTCNIYNIIYYILLITLAVTVEYIVLLKTWHRTGSETSHLGMSPKPWEKMLCTKRQQKVCCITGISKRCWNKQEHPSCFCVLGIFSDHRSCELRFPGDLMAKIEGILEVFSNFNHCLISLAAVFWSLFRK